MSERQQRHVSGAVLGHPWFVGIATGLIVAAIVGVIHDWWQSSHQRTSTSSHQRTSTTTVLSLSPTDSGTNQTATTTQVAVLKLSLPASATAGTAIPAVWSVKGARGGQLVIQEPEGTRPGWQVIERLKGRSGTVQLPARPLGAAYPYRIAWLGAGGRLLSQDKQTVNVFGNVTLEQLAGDNNSAGQTYSGPSFTFDYWVQESGESMWLNNGNSDVFNASAAKNSCRSVKIQFVLGDDTNNWPSDARDTATLKIVQESQNPVSVTAGFNQVATITANLVPGQSWGLNESDSASDASAISDENTYLNGSASCDTVPTGLLNN